MWGTPLQCPSTLGVLSMSDDLPRKIQKHSNGSKQYPHTFIKFPPLIRKECPLTPNHFGVWIGENTNEHFQKSGTCIIFPEISCQAYKKKVATGIISEFRRLLSESIYNCVLVETKTTQYHLHPKENTLVDTGKRMVRILPVKKEWELKSSIYIKQSRPL